MRVSEFPFRAESPPKAYNQDYVERLLRALEIAFSEHARALNGSLTLGDGTDVDNINGQVKEFTSSGTPGAENTIAHTLGAVPVGIIILHPPASGTVNKGTTAWDTTNIFLTCSAATQTVKILILAPPPS